MSSSFSRRFLLVSRGAGRLEEKKTDSSRLRAREHGERRFAGLDEKLNERKTRTWRFARTGENRETREKGEDTYREIVAERSKEFVLEPAYTPA